VATAVDENNQPQQQQQDGKKHNARQKQSLRARFCR
jgi:hypothetical protein